MKFPVWWSSIAWLVVFIVSSVYLYYRRESYLAGQASKVEYTVLLVWFLVLFITFVTDIKLPGGFGASRDLSERGTEKLDKATSDTAPLPQVADHDDMEKKILKTFWTKQVNRYDKWLKGSSWGFRIGSRDLQFFEWREAAMKLFQEGLISQNAEGLIFLTMRGFRYCKEHCQEFGDNEFWPQETIKEEMLKKVLAEGRREPPGRPGHGTASGTSVTN